MKIATKIPLTRMGRKDNPEKGWKDKYKNFPVLQLKVSHSFTAGEYEYGRTIAVKNACRKIAQKAGKNFSFAVREHNGKIRVWRVK